QVEIITSNAQTPSPTWERFVVTGKARARIRRFVRLQEREEYEKLGRSILARAFKDEGYDVSDKALGEVLTVFQQPSVADLCAQVGAGHLTGRAVVEAVYPGVKSKPDNDATIVSLAQARRRQPRSGEAAADGISIKGLIPGMAMHMAGCCHPLPGDRIVGIVTTGRGVTVHTIDCETLENYTEEPDRWIDLSWDIREQPADLHVGRINISVLNAPGSLGDLSTVIAKNNGNISNLKITNRSADFFDMLIDVEVRNVKHLTDIIAALRATPSINSVERARG
ncbi:MAG: RelA/SpoT AH/RIS domain-containing protein, partial [Rhodospirillaceae bacterium]